MNTQEFKDTLEKVKAVEKEAKETGIASYIAQKKASAFLEENEFNELNEMNEDLLVDGKTILEWFKLSEAKSESNKLLKSRLVRAALTTGAASIAGALIAKQINKPKVLISDDESETRFIVNGKDLIEDLNGELQKEKKKLEEDKTKLQSELKENVKLLTNLEETNNKLKETNNKLKENFKKSQEYREKLELDIKESSKSVLDLSQKNEELNEQLKFSDEDKETLEFLKQQVEKKKENSLENYLMTDEDVSIFSGVLRDTIFPFLDVQRPFIILVPKNIAFRYMQSKKEITPSMFLHFLNKDIRRPLEYNDLIKILEYHVIQGQDVKTPLTVGKKYKTKNGKFLFINDPKFVPPGTLKQINNYVNILETLEFEDGSIVLTDKLLVPDNLLYQNEPLQDKIGTLT